VRCLTKLILWASIMILCFTSLVDARADTPLVINISGTCQVSRPGTLVVFIVDEKRFRVPMNGIQSHVSEISVSTSSIQLIPFTFRVPVGRYALRCFLDTNGNGKLDRGLTGPLEPWGMSWQGKRLAGIPSFKDVSFQADHSLQVPLIIIE
jgi:uncharacterized protein (DUF2141 family)